MGDADDDILIKGSSMSFIAKDNSYRDDCVYTLHGSHLSFEYIKTGTKQNWILDPLISGDGFTVGKKVKYIRKGSYHDTGWNL